MARAEPEGPAPAASADLYWRSMDVGRTRARSLARAELGVRLLRQEGVEGGRLLEIGCGPGWALERFRAAGFQAAGIELSPAAANEARGRGLAVVEGDVEAGDLPGGNQVVAALEALEHLRDPLETLRRMARALAPGGRLLVSLPNEHHLPRRLAILLGRPQLAGHRRFGGHDDPHLRHFTPEECERLFAAAGLRSVARAWDGLAPPRWKGLRGVSQALARARPSLFAMAGIYVLAPREGAA